MNSFTSTLKFFKKTGNDKQGNYFMKSVIAQGSTIAKAIEEALKKADMPQEFFVKVLEEPQAGFLGFGSKKAKIALFFKNVIPSEKSSENMFSKGSYAGLFNNPEIKKQLDNQLKELGFEIKPIEPKKQEVKPKVIKKDFSQNPVKVTNLQVRPLGDKNQVKKPFVPKPPRSTTSDNMDSLDALGESNSANQEQAKTGQNKYRKYYRYRRNRYNKNRSDVDSNGVSNYNSSNSNNSDRDE